MCMVINKSGYDHFAGRINYFSIAAFVMFHTISCINYHAVLNGDGSCFGIGGITRPYNSIQINTVCCGFIRCNILIAGRKEKERSNEQAGKKRFKYHNASFGKERYKIR